MSGQILVFFLNGDIMVRDGGGGGAMKYFDSVTGEHKSFCAAQEGHKKLKGLEKSLPAPHSRH
jgi:hypothetical protein